MALCHPIDQTLTVPLHDSLRTAHAIRERAGVLDAKWKGSPPEDQRELINDLRRLATALEATS
jgi:hypothetical protein